MSKAKKKGIAPLIIMVVGFVVGILIGRGLEVNCEDDEDDLF